MPRQVVGTAVSEARIAKLEGAVVDLQARIERVERTQVILDTAITLARWLGPILIGGGSILAMVLTR